MSDAIVALVRLIEEVSGIVVPDRDHDNLAAFAHKRAQAAGLVDLDRYVRALRIDHAGEQWRALLSSITVKESYLFRAPQQIKALTEHVVPSLMRRRSRRRLLVWSAGCARGEEACTLAIALAQCSLLADWSWQVLATDVDETALDQARLGSYGARAVGRVPRDTLARHFQRKGDRYELDPSLRARIEYRMLNLMSSPLHLPEAPFDVVFLRNVLIYFRPEAQRRVGKAVADALAPDGFLFLGPAETMWQLCPSMRAVDLGDCFCYQRSETSEEPGPAIGSRGSLVGRQLVVSDRTSRGPAGDPSRSENREEVRDATPEDRSRSSSTSRNSGVADCASFAIRSREGLSGRASGGARSPAASVGQARRPEPSRKQALSAVTDLLAGGDTSTAATMIEHALRRTPEDASLRALQGVVFEAEHDLGCAVAAYRAALYLDPMLFQVRYLLFRCMERLGWTGRAQRERRQVMATLDSRDARLLEGAERLSVPDRDEVIAGCRRS